MATNRVTTEGLEVLRDGPAQARVTTEGMEVLHSGNIATQARVTSLGMEVLHAASTAKARVSSLGLEVLRSVAQAVATQVVTRYSQFGLNNLVGSPDSLDTGSAYWQMSHPGTNPSPGTIQIDFGYRVKLKSWAFIKSLGTMGDWDIVGSNVAATSTADVYVPGNGDVRISTFHDTVPGPGQQDVFSCGQTFSGGAGFRYYRLLLVGPLEPTTDIRLTGLTLNRAIVLTPFGYATQYGSQTYAVDGDFSSGWTPFASTFPAADASNIPALQFDMGEIVELEAVTFKTNAGTTLGASTLWGSNNPATSTADTVQTGDVQLAVYSKAQMNSGLPLPTNASGRAFRYYRFAASINNGPDGSVLLEFTPALAVATFSIDFSDGATDGFATATLTTKFNPVMRIDFTDDGEMNTIGSFYPSAVVQTMVHTSGRG